MPDRQAVGEKLDEIEAELHRTGRWDVEPPESLEVSSAFGLDTMAFEQWLRYVFVPNVRSRLAEDDLPASSMVATQAIRELDGAPDADRLIGLLAEFDALFG